MPAAESTLREEVVDRRQAARGPRPIRRADLNSGPVYLSIETALGMRPQIQRCNQLSGSRVHRKKSVSNRGESRWRRQRVLAALAA